MFSFRKLLWPRKNAEFDEAIFTISAKFMTKSLDEAVLSSLEDLGEFAYSARACVFLLDEDAKYMNKTYEWVWGGNKYKGMQKFACNDLQWLMKKFENNQTIHIANIKKMPNEAYAEKTLFEIFNIKAFLFVPLNINGILKGFVGIENVIDTGHWGRNEISLTKLYTEILANAIQRDQYQQSLMDSEERYRQLIEHSPNGLIVHDDGIIIYANPSAANILHVNDCLEMIGISIDYFALNVDDESKKAMIENRKQLVLQGQAVPPIELNYQLKDGSIITIEIVSIPFITKGKLLTQMLIKDITSKKQTEIKINNLAFYDQLTGLPNRTYFNNIIEEKLHETKENKYAVMFLDLDRFKCINDTLGHHIGDNLLKSIAESVSIILDKNIIVSRMGGDEFCLISPINKREDAEIIARKIINIFVKPFILDNNELYITTSIGIAIYPNDGTTSYQLIKNADIAMYQAKDSGRNTYRFFNQQMDIEASNRMKLTNNLRKALENEEFILHYQPKFNVNTNEIIGMEALVRWSNAQLGIIPPSDFIPLAEETGLIIPLGEWVLKEACKQNKQWQDRGFKPMTISVNISGKQFTQGNLLEIVQKVLNETKLDPKYLELEITESTAIQDIEFTLETLNKFKEIGISISLDDFGTGYSSLNYLKRMNIDILKIDKSFIHEIEIDKSSKSIVNAIIVMAHNLNKEVIAEGVETKEQLEFLKLNNCDKIQGFYFSKPLTIEQFENLLQKSMS